MMKNKFPRSDSTTCLTDACFWLVLPVELLSGLIGGVSDPAIQNEHTLYEFHTPSVSQRPVGRFSSTVNRHNPSDTRLPTGASPYAEREPATGREIQLDYQQAQSARHEFGSGHCPVGKFYPASDSHDPSDSS